MTTMRLAMHLTATLSLALMIGCGAHKVRGVVVVGDTSYVQLVDPHDPRLEGEPVVGATVTGVIDPQSLNSTRLTGVLTDNVGSFAIPIEQFGAGWLEYELGLMVRRKNFTPAEGYVPLPGNDQRLLIVLSPGRDRSVGMDSAFDDEYSADRDLERFAH